MPTLRKASRKLGSSKRTPEGMPRKGGLQSMVLWKPGEGSKSVQKKGGGSWGEEDRASLKLIDIWKLLHKKTTNALNLKIRMKYTKMLMAVVLYDQGYYLLSSVFFPYSMVHTYVTFIIEKAYSGIKDTWVWTPRIDVKTQGCLHRPDGEGATKMKSVVELNR